MLRREIVVSMDRVAQRIDKVISEEIQDLSRSYIKKLFENNIKVNGNLVRPNYKVKSGDIIIIDIPKDIKTDVSPENIELDIIYEDENLLVINKPAGMVVHPGAGNYNKTLVNALLHHCKGNLSTVGGQDRAGIVHRLDKDTTGLIVAAKDNETHLCLSKLLKDRKVKKQYITIVHGNIKEDEFKIQKNIIRNPKNRKQMTVSDKDGREATTHVKVLERFYEYTLVNCNIVTGRTHQIRVHMKHKGNPVLGDKTYGVKREEFNLSGQLLHAEKIGFVHPQRGEYMEFYAPLPEDFKKILNLIRQKYGQAY